MRNRSDDRDGAISMTRQEARKGESQLKSEPRRGEKEGSPRRAEKALCYYARPRHRMNF